MNLLLNLPLVTLYPGYVPDFGILDYWIYSYGADCDINNAHAAWDGFWVVATPFLLVLLYRGFKKLLIISKQLKVTKLVNHFAEKDPFWDRNSMREMAKNLFYEVQGAWRHNNFKSLAPLLTDKIKMEWMDTWKQMRLNQYIFVVSRIDIRSVTIISVEDHFDDNQDKFKVEISGYINRYVKNKPGTAMYMRGASDYEEFTDIYSFVRYNDQWLLDDIHHSANIREILMTRNRDYHLN